MFVFRWSMRVMVCCETGLHYNYFRYYDSKTGRYITSDPIGLDGGLNTFGYVGGNPVGLVDPFGLKTFFCWGIIRTYPHARLCVNNICGGIMPGYEGSCPGGGYVQTETFDKDQCIEMKVPDKCDQNVYEQCLLKEISSQTCTEYDIFTRNCLDWGSDTSKKCAKQACGK